MMVDVGRTSTLEVTRTSDAGYFLTDGDGEVLLPTRLASKSLEVGETVEVFVYTDSEDRPIATTQRPLAQVGDFACLKVIDQNEHGAFLNWGLDKDLFVPKNEQHHRLTVGRSYVVAVFLDTRTNRVAAASRLAPFLDYDVSEIEQGQEVELVVYGVSDRGAQVIVDDCYSGNIHKSEMFSKLDVGQKLTGYVAKVREDNKLDIRLRRTGTKGHKDAASVVLEALEKAGGELPYGDKSDPGSIKRAFGLSKKAFKAAVGTLYKQGLVIPSLDKIRSRNDQ